MKRLMIFVRKAVLNCYGTLNSLHVTHKSFADFGILQLMFTYVPNHQKLSLTSNDSNVETSLGFVTSGHINPETLKIMLF